MPPASPQRHALRWIVLAALPIAAPTVAGEPSGGLAELVGEASEIEIPSHAGTEYAAAAESYRDLLRRLGEIDRAELEPADTIDHELLEAHLRTRLFEIEELRLHELVPVRYLALSN